MDADGVAGRAADGLQGDDPVGGDSDSSPHVKLEQRKHHVADGVASRDERSQPADDWCEDRPGGSRQPGRAGSYRPTKSESKWPVGTGPTDGNI